MRTAVAIGGLAGMLWFYLWLSGDSEGERQLKQEMAAKRAEGVTRADPFQLSKTLSNFLRFIEPEAAPQFISLGISLAIHGLTPEAQQHEKFSAVADLKAANAVMSWADFGAFVAFHALKEMGAPLVFVSPKFGRTEQETARRTVKPFPSSSASLDEILAWGSQFGLSTPETVAVLGGQEAGSLLFTGAKERDLTTSIFQRVAHAGEPSALDDIPFGRALAENETTRQCCYAFAQDHLYWNKYFVQGLVRILEADWYQIKELPHRMSGTTRDSTWATRQKMIYGVDHEYKGSALR